MIRGRDGALYSAFFAIVQSGREAQNGTCIMRASDVSAPSSWRLWDGQGFNIVASNPYISPGPPACAILSPQELDGFRGSSLPYNTYLRRYMLVGIGMVSIANGARDWGMLLSISADLIPVRTTATTNPAPLPS